MFKLKEAAIAHALAAEKLIEPNEDFLNSNEAVIPIFINLLLQSLEITLKAIALESGLATESELRSRSQTRNGHGIEELAKLLDSKMHGKSVVDCILPRQGYAHSNDILKAMIFDSRFSPSRDSYAKRNLTYSQFKPGELQIIQGAKTWVNAVAQSAKNIDLACDEIRCVLIG